MITSKIKLFALLVVATISSCKSIDFVSEETPLMKAALRADVVKMKKEIKAGANVNAVADREQPHGGKPVLRYAIDSGCVEAVHILLEAGANPNDFTTSPLFYKNKPHKANIRNLSLLSHSVNSKVPIAIIKELIKFGAHLDGSPKIAGDWSPLMIAAFRGNKEAVMVLLQAGADVAAVNSMDNKTALDYAQKMKHQEIVEILKTHELNEKIFKIYAHNRWANA